MCGGGASSRVMYGNKISRWADSIVRSNTKAAWKKWCIMSVRSGKDGQQGWGGQKRVRRGHGAGLIEPK